jgi:glycosyltransferase involved in cell wall biosynthesis
MTGKPTISVLMPFHNAQPTIAAAVRSIVDQTFTDWELLMPDDGSTDGSRTIVESFADPRITVWSDGRQMGLAPRLNETIARARGHYIARMDSDDISYPDRFKAQLEFLASHPEVDLVGASVVVFGEDGQALGKRIVPETHAQIAAHPFSGFGLAHPTWMVRAEWFHRNQYDPSAIRFEDYELLFRTYQTSRFANLPGLLYGYREPQDGLRKRLKTRLGRVRYFKDHASAEARALFWPAARQEAWKAAVDAAIVLSSRRYAALKTRMAPVTLEENAQWEAIRRSACRT